MPRPAKTEMPATVSPPATTGKMPWFVRSLAMLPMAAVGGMGILAMRWAVYGNPDPFTNGLPLSLWIGSFVLTLTFAALGRAPFAAALGLYGGQVVYMLVSQRVEYPVSSMIALAVHGLLPALGAACFASWIQAKR